MKSQDKIIKLINKSTFHSVFIEQFIIQRAEELIKNEKEFLEQNKNMLVDPQTILDIAKDCIQELKSKQ